MILIFMNNPRPSVPGDYAKIRHAREGGHPGAEIFNKNAAGFPLSRE